MSNKRKQTRKPDTLKEAVRVWRTPLSHDWKGPNMQEGPSASSNGLHAQVVKKARPEKGYLNPAWVDPLMGYESGYTNPEGKPDQGMISSLSWIDGSWEDQIPRIVTRNPERAKRIRALGNAVVPECVAVLFEQIGKHIKNNSSCLACEIDPGHCEK